MPNLNIRNIYEWPLASRLFVFCCVFAVAFYVGYFFDLSNLITTLQETKAKETELKQQYQTTVKKVATLQNTLAQYQEYTRALTDSQKKFIRYTDLPELLNEILKLASNNQLYVNLFSPGDAIQDQHYEKIPIHAIVVGTYHQIANFISEIANLKWTVVVANFFITTEAKNDVLGAKLAEQAAARNLLLADLHLEIYYVPIPKPASDKASEAKDKKPAEAKPDATTPAAQGPGHGQ